MHYLEYVCALNSIFKVYAVCYVQKILYKKNWRVNKLQFRHFQFIWEELSGTSATKPFLFYNLSITRESSSQ